MVALLLADADEHPAADGELESISRLYIQMFETACMQQAYTSRGTMHGSRTSLQEPMTARATVSWHGGDLTCAVTTGAISVAPHVCRATAHSALRLACSTNCSCSSRMQQLRKIYPSTCTETALPAASCPLRAFSRSRSVLERRRRPPSTREN